MDAYAKNMLSQSPELIERTVLTVSLKELQSEFRADRELLLVDFALAAADQTKPNNLVEVFDPVVTKLYACVDFTDAGVGLFLELRNLLEFEFEQIPAIPKLKPDFVYSVGAGVGVYVAGTQTTSPDDSRVISTFVSSPSLPVIWKLVSMN